MGKERVYIKKENKGYLVTILILLVVVLITVAIVTLLTKQVARISSPERNGLARSFLFPFIFSDDSNTLYILKDENQLLEVDDSASDHKHDLKKDKIFYIRENVLYEYDIKTETRKALEKDVLAYYLMANRSAILCIGEDSIRLYLYKDRKSYALASGYKLSLNESPVMGDDYFIYLDNVKANKADLYLGNEVGKTKMLAGQIDATKSFGVGKEDKYIYFYKDNQLYLLNKEGEILGNFPNSQIIRETKQALLIEANTEYKSTKNTYDILYLLSNVSEDGTKGDLLYLKGKKSIEISLDVSRIIYYSLENQLLIFAKADGDMEDIYFSRRGSQPSYLFKKEVKTKYIFESSKGYLYAKGPDDKLERVSIYDKNNDPIGISSRVADIYDYLNKGIFVYEEMYSGKQNYILEDNQIEKEEMNGKRLYGIKDDSYLYIRINENQRIVLDLVAKGSLKRVTGNLTGNLFFEKNLDQLIYQEGNKLFFWQDGKKTEIGEFTKIKSALLVD